MSKNFDKFNEVLDIYMPPSGEGDSLGSQIATAVAKIAYRWFNDGDTIAENCVPAGYSKNGGVAQFANWLNANVPEARECFDDWYDTIIRWDGIAYQTYEKFLYNLCQRLIDEDLLEMYSQEPKKDSIYNARKYADPNNRSLRFKPEDEDGDY